MTDLRDTSLSFYRAWYVALGAKHGLFLALRDAPLAPGELAAELGLDARAVDDWCSGAAALDLLTARGGRYRLAPAHADTLGEPASPAYLGHHFEYLTAKSLGFGALDDLLRGQARAPDLAATYALATRWDHLAFFDLFLPTQRALSRKLTEGVEVLDLGAGQGGWTREAARRFPRSRFTAADLDLAPLADLQALDARRLPRARFDVVFLGEVLAAAKEPARVLRAAHRALRPGGQLVALEGLAPRGRARGWGERLVRAMQLDFALDGSRYLSEPEARAALREAGFPRARVRDLGGSLFAIRAGKREGIHATAPTRSGEGAKLAETREKLRALRRSAPPRGSLASERRG